MLRARSLLPLALCCACTTSAANTEETTPPSGANQAAATVDAAGGAAFDAEIVQTAISASTVDKMKVRLDGDGNLLKQTVYHDDAASIPEVVKALAKEKFPQAPVTGYETELYADLGRVYEVIVDDGGKKCEVAAKPDGTELYTECQVDAASLSAEIKATIEKTAPGGKILEAETKKGPDIDETTVEVETGGRELYLRIGPDGTLLQAVRRVPGVIEVPLQ